MKLCSSVSAALPLLVLPLWAQTGAVSGATQAAGSKPAPGAIVTLYVALGVNSPTDPPIHIGRNIASTTSDAAGNFAFKEVQPGYYILCARSPRREELDPCDWSLVPPNVRVIAGAEAKVTVELPRGVPQRVRLLDAGKRLAAARDSLSLGPPLTAYGMTPRGLRGYFDMTSTTDVQTDMDLIIPEEVDVPVYIQTPAASINDDRGQSLRARATPLTLRVAKGATSPAPVVLTVGPAVAGAN